MLKTDNTPMRARVIQGTSYQIGQPFTAEHFEAATEVGANAAGLANAANQLLAENLGNNMAGRIKKAVKDGGELPTQDDMDALYAAYDFSGARVSALAAGSLFDKIMFRNSSQFIRRLLKQTGYQGAPAPVTVAKKGTEAGDGQIDYDTFESEVSKLMNGEGPWGEGQAFIDLRDELIAASKAEEERVRAAEQAAEGKLSELTLG